MVPLPYKDPGVLFAFVAEGEPILIITKRWL
jgi:hypothetical protein